MNKKHKLGIILSTLGVVMILVGVTFSFFNYTRTGVSNVIKVGRISFESNQTNTITLLNVFPIDKTNVNSSSDVGTVTISIEGDTTYDDGVEYLLTVSNLTNTINDKEIPIDVIVTGTGIGEEDDSYFDNRGGNSSIYKVLTEGTIINDKKLLVGYITKGTDGVDGTVTIKAYLDKEKIAITDTYDGEESDNMGTTTAWVNGRLVLTSSEWNNLNNSGVSFQVRIEANEGVWVTGALTGEQMVRQAINSKINAETNSCNPIWLDEEDNITYFSGTNDCVDMNYVWYSGKLWRISAIYPNGAMKLVTQDTITSIEWGSNIEYDGSWIYQWLNEDFYDTLHNANNIIENNTWNYSIDGNSTPVRPETINNQKTKVAPIGLLNAYEYYNSYRNSNYLDNYLNTSYYWWLITPYSNSNMNYITYTGEQSNGDPSVYSIGVRPSIIIKSGLEFTGSGTKTLPYKIVGDKEDAVNNTTLLSSRLVGEYVKFDNDLYRIVDIDNGITKLTRVDYLRDTSDVMQKKLSSSVYYGKSNNVQNDTYWDYYLNNIWYTGISTTYKNMLVDGTYYLGVYSDNTNYKATLCKNATLDNVTTKNCTKYTSGDTDKTFTGKVGLPRVGEMFASQIGNGYASARYVWTVTPYSNMSMRLIYNESSLNNYQSSISIGSARPSITLKSGIKITSGTGYVGGDTNSPFEISE